MAMNLLDDDDLSSVIMDTPPGWGKREDQDFDAEERLSPTPTKPKRLSIAAHSVESNHSDNGLSESDLSSVIDDKPAPRKRRKNTQSGKEKVAHEDDKDDTTIKNLKSYVLKCGVRKVWSRELKNLSKKQQVSHLKSILNELGVHGRPTVEKCLQVRRTRELQAELNSMDVTNIIHDDEKQGRRTRASRGLFNNPEKQGSNGDKDTDESQKTLPVTGHKRVYSKSVLKPACLGNISKSPKIYSIQTDFSQMTSIRFHGLHIATHTDNMTDFKVPRPRFFTTARKGENYELQADLNSEYRDKRKDAIKKVIANMTVGKDVSGLFSDVLKNMQTEDLEQKKLVYLYLMNYAKSQPNLVILAVNTFVKDTDDSNPLIRALAIRTMGCLRVEQVVDYLCEPLRKCMRDENPYVRKTAAICVAKLYDLNPELAVENGFVALLQEMMSDSNSMVVANAVTALAEIDEVSPDNKVFVINGSTLSKLLIALNECTEWGRIAILEALAEYKPIDAKEAEHIIERVSPQFQHANGSVVLAAIKVVVILMRYIKNEELEKSLVKRMAPPLVTLLSSAPEVQYVALRNINLILQKRKDILQNEMRVFFCKYNDPPYVKLEKLDILIKLANNKNVDQLLSELKEYASEVDVDFVRKSVRAIGQCAVKIDETSERCINVLLDLINTKVNYVVQEAIIVIKDIFRKYPHKYTTILPTLCKNLEVLDEPEAKASLIWIIGEYAESISNASELILSFLDTFREENLQVQLQLVASCVKLFLKKPTKENEGIVYRVLKVAAQECDNPDLRDRAYIYWRLLSTDPQAAKAVVLSDKPVISISNSTLSEQLLEQLLNDVGSLASVYHKPPETFLGRGRFGADAIQRKAIEEQEESIRETPLQIQTKTNVENLLDIDFSSPATPTSSSAIPASTAPPSVSSTAATSAGPIDDLLDLFSGTSMDSSSNGAGTTQGQNGTRGNGMSNDDILGLF
ncbi:11521_t:CDS:10 [Paraglomus brasilianum]|uniref:11521_t:CDS:1 n=1 Tax=Paraglomus brasilianum TaxID=144538 RepID=A0A9N9GQL5_9GLOM|nr:11521_t:CDS:10 [Paraglomus brasilianum]